jgi:hypothetical protein
MNTSTKIQVGVPTNPTNYCRPTFSGSDIYVLTNLSTTDLVDLKQGILDVANQRMIRNVISADFIFSLKQPDEISEFHLDLEVYDSNDSAFLTQTYNFAIVGVNVRGQFGFYGFVDLSRYNLKYQTHISSNTNGLSSKFTGKLKTK